MACVLSEVRVVSPPKSRDPEVEELLDRAYALANSERKADSLTWMARLGVLATIIGITIVVVGGFSWGGKDWNHTEGEQFRAWLNQHGATADQFAENHPELAANFDGVFVMSTQQKIVQAAMAQIGDPYSWGAAGPDYFDCSGLVMYAYGTVGIYLPHQAASQQALGLPVTLEQAQPGDLVFYGWPASHVALYAGDLRVIEAPYSGENVRVDTLGAFTEIRRIL